MLHPQNRGNNMYKLCKTEQAAKRQRQLEKGLLQAMLHSRYEDISISDLCEQMQVPRKSFYRYFSSKDGALFALLDHTLMEFSASTDALRRGTALGDLERYFAFWYAHADLLEALRRSQLSGMLVERSTKLALQENMMPSRFLEWTPKFQRMAMSFSVCGLLSMVLQWQEENYQLSPAEMAKIATTMLTQPLIPT